MKKVNNSKVANFNSLLIFAVFALLVLIGGVGYLALSPKVLGIDLQKFASTRTTRKIVSYAKRGNIYDANGNTLAQDVSSYTLIAYLDPNRTTDPEKPKHVVDKENTALMLSTLIDLDYDTILRYLSKTNVYQTEFGKAGKGLNEITKDRIKNTNLPGIDFIETTKRYYPYGDFASYVVGYAKTTDDGELIGEMGVEKKLNDKLTGTNGFTEYQKDRNGYKIANTQEVKVDSKDGGDVYLTIDANAQFLVEEAVNKYADKSYSNMSIVVADKNGKILALVNDPSFDPNYRNITNYMDEVSAVAYEPGSTMKIFTYMAAIENGVYNGNAYYKSGSFTATDGTVIRDYNDYGWGTITYDQGFKHSSNTGICNLITNYMNRNMLKKYFVKLGFGTKTGIDLPLEANGKLDFKYETEVLNAGFGQGITATPIQMIQALTSIANDGIMVKPYIVSKVLNKDGNTIYSNEREELGRVASSDTIDYIKNLMYHTINDSDGAGISFKINGYDLIGKTGTAQIADGKGGYLAHDVNRSIALMFPKENPEIIIYGAAKYATSIYPLSSSVKDIVVNLSKYYNIYDNKDKNELNEIELDNYINRNIKTVSSNLKEVGLNVITIGDGDKIINQYPSNGNKLIKGDRIYLVTNGTNYNMIDLNDYSYSEVKTFCNLVNITCNLSGNGYVYEQSIGANTLINKESVLNLKLKYKY